MVSPISGLWYVWGAGSFEQEDSSVIARRPRITFFICFLVFGAVSAAAAKSILGQRLRIIKAFQFRRRDDLVAARIAIAGFYYLQYQQHFQHTSRPVYRFRHAGATSAMGFWAPRVGVGSRYAGLIGVYLVSRSPANGATNIDPPPRLRRVLLHPPNPCMYRMLRDMPNIFRPDSIQDTEKWRRFSCSCVTP